MRHLILTCRNHPQLRWSCKEIAWSEQGGYNGVRSIFFLGEPSGKGMYEDMSGLDCTKYFPDREEKIVHECTCSGKDLILAPEDALVKR